jgi:hypothetical protein
MASRRLIPPAYFHVRQARRPQRIFNQRCAMHHCVAMVRAAIFSGIRTPFAMEPAMTTETRDTRIQSISTMEQLRCWLATNRVHGLSAGQPAVRCIEATSLADGSATSLEVPTDLFRALAPEMVWMHEVDTLPGGILLALRSQLENTSPAF